MALGGHSSPRPRPPAATEPRGACGLQVQQSPAGLPGATAAVRRVEPSRTARTRLIRSREPLPVGGRALSLAGRLPKVALESSLAARGRPRPRDRGMSGRSGKGGRPRKVLSRHCALGRGLLLGVFKSLEPAGKAGTLGSSPNLRTVTHTPLRGRERVEGLGGFRGHLKSPASHPTSGV